MPHPRGSPTIKPIFTQGLSLNTRLFSAVLLSIILMVLDHREKHLDELRSALSVLIYPIQYIASLPTQLARQGAESLADRDQLNQDRQRLAQQNLVV